MKSNNAFSAYVDNMENNSNKLLASPKHTLGLITIILLITIAGAINASRGSGDGHSDSPLSPFHMIGVFMFMIGLE